MVIMLQNPSSPNKNIVSYTDDGSQYFDKKTQKAIEKFLKAKSEIKKNSIFQNQIRYSFYKLAENLIFVNKLKFDDMYENIKNDCVTFLFENLHKYDLKRKTKAFSYFNTVAKNWLILKSKEHTKTVKTNVHYVERNKLDDDTHNENLKQKIVDDAEQEILRKEFLSIVNEQFQEIESRIRKEKVKEVLSAINFLFKNIDDIDITNKKAIFLYLRNITGFNTKQLLSALTSVRKIYKRIKTKYNRGDI